MEIPKLFISYSWSNIDHQQWVLDLATQLRESGVDVILDKWDLKEGHDAYKFMEQMVNNPDIKKVVIVTDKMYAIKANDREGGVGTETQIISKEIYDKQDQDKFVAVVRERDEQGNPYLPTYFKSRIYIDFSEPYDYSGKFEMLLRWIFNEPLHKKPDIGKKPSFLDEGETISLGTTLKFRTAIDAIKNSKAHAAGALDEYLNTFAENLEAFRIEKSDEEFDEVVLKNIERFLPYRNEAIQLFNYISQYAPNEENIQKLHRFFEKLVPYLYHQENVRQYDEFDLDNFRFIIHELFLYVMAILIKDERFEQANYFLEQRYYLAGSSVFGRDVMKRFTIFRLPMRSLANRNKRLGLNHPSLRADLLKERFYGIGIKFNHFMQADFVLFMRDEIEFEYEWNEWWPETLLYIRHYYGPFEIFARATSKKYFDRVKCLLVINIPKDLEDLLRSFKQGERKLPKWDYYSFNPSELLGYDNLSKSP